MESEFQREPGELPLLGRTLTPPVPKRQAPSSQGEREQEPSPRTWVGGKKDLTLPSPGRRGAAVTTAHASGINPRRRDKETGS